MSKALEKVRGVRTLPLFPLPLILLPGEVIPLHIFEPRYRQMLEDIQAGNNLFGLSYFEPGGAEQTRPPAGHTGCVAELKEAETLPDGRSNIVVAGVVRYRMEEYVTFFEDAEEDGLDELAKEVKEFFTRVANAAHNLSGERGALPDLPDIGPQELSFLIAASFNFENEVKIELMETRSTRVRLEALRTILKQAAEKIDETAHISKISKTNGHSKKPVDLN
jgi:ATP-dependent Lon protease